MSNNRAVTTYMQTMEAHFQRHRISEWLQYLAEQVQTGDTLPEFNAALDRLNQQIVEIQHHYIPRATKVQSPSQILARTPTGTPSANQAAQWSLDKLQEESKPLKVSTATGWQKYPQLEPVGALISGTRG
eukprot:CCRYP_012570-RA/>CCRYP_012570-RA protein AED:0.45 eAED:0.75 QI:0/0/0/1/0/0/2/0/129